MSLVHNEQTKLEATALNNLGVASIVTGFLGPMVAYSLGLGTVPVAPLTVAATFGWLLAGIALHILGSLSLTVLEE